MRRKKRTLEDINHGIRQLKQLMVNMEALGDRYPIDRRIEHHTQMIDLLREKQSSTE